MFRHSLWAGSENWLSLVEHLEGDGHCGIEATVDIRATPRTSRRPTFPLQTNLIF